MVVPVMGPSRVCVCVLGVIPVDVLVYVVRDGSHDSNVDDDDVDMDIAPLAFTSTPSLAVPPIKLVSFRFATYNLIDHLSSKRLQIPDDIHMLVVQKGRVLFPHGHHLILGDDITHNIVIFLFGNDGRVDRNIQCRRRCRPLHKGRGGKGSSRRHHGSQHYRTQCNSLCHGYICCFVFFLDFCGCNRCLVFLGEGPIAAALLLLLILLVVAVAVEQKERVCCELEETLEDGKRKPTGGHT